MKPIHSIAAVRRLVFAGAAFLLLSSFSVAASADCTGNRYQEKIFDEVEIVEHIVFATKQRSDGLWQDLVYDVYMPANDTETNRPAIMLAHGGAYLELLDQKSPDIVKLAREFAQRGYVVISPDYRQEPNVFSLFSEEQMIKAVGRALIDIRDATCQLMDTTTMWGNPFGVDPSTVFVGGVSAGAVSFLQAVLLDSLAWLPERFQEWLLEVEPNSQALLDNKYCGATVKGLINISGAVLDTAWIKAYKADEYPAMMHVHGAIDPVVPYGHDYPFGITLLPKLMGSSLIDARARRLGIRTELDTYPTQGHAPIIGVNWEALLFGELEDFIFNYRIMNNTIRHMSDFMYSLINCDPNLPTGIDEQAAGALTFFPNPSKDRVRVQLPPRNSVMDLQIFNNLGQSVFRQRILPFEEDLLLHHDLGTGLYTIRISDNSNASLPLTGQLVVVQ